MIVQRHVGNCQVCEGDFKSTPGGILALHGYKRPGNGSVHGRCPGEGSLAYERSRELIPLVISGYRADEARACEYIREIDAGEVTVLYRKEMRGRLEKSVEITPSDATWAWELLNARRAAESQAHMARETQKHYVKRYDAWQLRPLRTLDEEGRTPEQKDQQESRANGRLAVKNEKEAKAEATRIQRGKTLLERKAILDRAGAMIRDAAARGDKAAVLQVLEDLGKKKNKSLLEPSFAMESLDKLKRYGTVPADLPDDIASSKDECIAYHWETDLHADGALLALGLAERVVFGRGIKYARVWTKF